LLLERPENGGIAPVPFQKWATGVEEPFHTSMKAGNFILYHGGLETHLLQLFAHSANSEWSSIISVIVFAVTIIDEQKQT